MKGIWFDDVHSYEHLNLVLSKISIPPAAAKTTYVNIPGGDGSVDLTEALGEVKFKDRNCTFTFTVFPYEDFTEKNLGKGYEDFCKKLAMAYEDIESLSPFEKLALHNSICNIVEMRSEYTNEHNAKNINMYGNIYENEFSTIYHEIGHCFDFKSKSLINAYIDSFKHQKDLKPFL